MSSLKRLLTGVAFAATVWVSAGVVADAAPLFEPDATWTTLETPHFRIYYGPGFEAKAKQVAAIAEDVHAKLVPFMQVTTGGPTEVIISDGYDELNSMAHSSPHRAIWLWQTPPNPDEGMWIGRYDQWMRLLFIHEYTHILQFEHTSWIANQTNSALGGLIFSVFPQLPIDITLNLPDLLTNAPAFFTEGLAVYTESTLTPGGRGTEGDFDMVRRMAFLEGTVPTMDQAWGRFLLDWPMGGYEYTWGSSFIQHLVKRCGADAPAKIMKTYGQLPWLGFESAVHRATGTSVAELWDGMRAELSERYQADLTAHQTRRKVASAQGGWVMPTPKDITTSGRYHRHPRWGQDGTLYYTEALKNQRPQLFARSPKGETTFVMGKSTRSAPALSPDAQKIYFEADTEDTFKKLSSFRDLFVYDRATKKSKRLTHGARTFAPAVSPDGKCIAAVTSGGARAGIAIFDAEGKQLRKWSFDNNDYQFGNPSWSPDGRQLAVAVWQGGHRDLFLMAPETGAMTRLWNDAAVDFYPTWTPDGQQLVFTSDRTGIFNLYAYDLGTRSLTQLTDVIGGVFDPAVSPDGKTIAFTNYSGRGYDIQTIPFEQAKTARPVALARPAGLLPDASTANVPVEPIRIGGYNPLGTFLPSTWFPILMSDEWGQSMTIYSFWQDVLRQHNLTLYGGMGFFSQRLNYGFRYTNNQGPFQWTAAMSEFPNVGRLILGQDPNNPSFGSAWQWNKSASVIASFPGLRNPMFDPPPISGDNWNVGVRTETVNDYALTPDEGTDAQGRPLVIPLPSHPSQPFAQDEGVYNSVFVEWQRANALKFPYDYGPTAGQLTSIGVEQGVPALGGDKTFTRLWGDHRFYQALPWGEKHSLAVRTTAGAVLGKNGEFFYSQWRAPFGYTPLSTVNRWDLTNVSSFDNRSVLVRGYPFLAGNRNLTFNTEYRFPLGEIMRGWGGGPVFLNRIYGVGFWDNGFFWGTNGYQWDTPALDDFKSGIGAELRAQTTMFQAVPIDVRGGLAYGLTSGGALQYNFGLGTTF